MRKLLVLAAIAGLFVATSCAMEQAKKAFTDAVDTALKNDSLISEGEVVMINTALTTYKDAVIKALRDKVGTAKTQIEAVTTAFANALEDISKVGTVTP